MGTHYHYGGGNANPPTKGTATQVLTSNGAGQRPTYQAAAGGGGGQLELIEHKTVAGNIEFSGISGYKYLLLVFNLEVGTASDIAMTFNNDAGANYEFVRVSSSAVGGATAQNAIQIAEARTDYAVAGQLTIGVDTLNDKVSVGCYSGNQSTRWQLMSGAWSKGSAGAVTIIDITGTTLSGFATLYGYKET